MINRKSIFIPVIFMFLLLFSCRNNGDNKQTGLNERQKPILQQVDGTISLNVEKADCYQDKGNPSSNTAEWNVKVSKSGRFDVWLSSATTDTTDLKYGNPVLLNIMDKRIEKKPACDRVVRNSGDVRYPYFRADSFLGSLYIQDTGLFNVQIISDKIISAKEIISNPSDNDNTKLLSVQLMPSKN
jgi:hypothetical protein